MVLKIFVKRLPGGEPVTNPHYQQQIIEGDEILRADNLHGFEFSITRAGEDIPFERFCNTETHGYEILNDKGVTVERYVSAVSDQHVAKLNKPQQ